MRTVTQYSALPDWWIVRFAVLTAGCLCAVAPAQAIDQQKGGPNASISSLELDADSLDNPVHNEALTKLRELLGGNQLSAEDTAAIVAQALRWQADDKTKWDAHWGDFVEAAHDAGKVPVDSWRKYLLGGIRVELAINPQGTRTDGITMSWKYENWRTGSDGPRFRTREHGDYEYSGIAANPWRSTGYSIVYLASLRQWRWKEDLTDPLFATLKAGPQTFHYRFHVEIFDSIHYPDDIVNAVPFGERVFEGTLPWVLLPDKAVLPNPTLINDPSLRPAVEKWLHVDQLMRDAADPNLVKLELNHDNAPTNVGFDVTLRAGDRSWPMGTVAWSIQESMFWDLYADLPLEIDHVDVVFTPNAADTAKLIRRHSGNLGAMRTIWNGEIVFANVPVQPNVLGPIRVDVPTPPEALEDGIDAMVGDGPAIRRVKQDDDLAAARNALEQLAHDHPSEPEPIYNLACVALADSGYDNALQYLVDAKQLNPPRPLADQIQRLLRLVLGIYENRAANDDAAAMYHLGLMYQYGWGPAKTIDQAKRWYRDAANDGNADAMCRLAWIYDRRFGATQNTPAAIEWYRLQTAEWYHKAAELGNEEAKQWVAAQGPH